MTTAASASQRVFDAVREEILAGDLRGGELLSEVVVSERFGVSRTPVHEAFLRLAAEDFLRLESRRGAVVVPVSPAEARDILEMRHALEVAAAGRLIGSLGADDRAAALAGLAGLLDDQRTHAAAGDVAVFADADARFHEAIVAASGNRLNERFYATLADRQRRMAVGSFQGRPAALAGLVDEHARLGDLVRDGDLAAFSEALLHHLAAGHAVAFGVER